MKWVKASERLPLQKGFIFCKCDFKGFTNYLNQIAIYNENTGKWSCENNAVRVIEWLDESDETKTSPATNFTPSLDHGGNLLPEGFICQHEALEDTKEGYYVCPICKGVWTVQEWNNRETVTSPVDVSLEEVALTMWKKLTPNLPMHDLYLQGVIQAYQHCQQQKGMWSDEDMYNAWWKRSGKDFDTWLTQYKQSKQKM